MWFGSQHLTWIEWASARVWQCVCSAGWYGAGHMGRHGLNNGDDGDGGDS